MTSTITIGKRIGIVGLAALCALTVAAAPATASVDCAALQATHDGLEARITTLQDMLGEASPAQKPAIIAQIKRLEAQEAAVDQQLAAAGCP